ncbi:MAG: radical SAM protein [Alphaproteobacteria bacterium]|nr:radical SAM protein [Alphaproteobacteria bacterium]
MKPETESLCPVCLEAVPARKIIKGKDVFLEKTCAAHGRSTVQVAKDAKRFFDKTFDLPGKAFVPITTYHGRCGEDCGWCDAHTQHVCTGLIEVTDCCDLACPICYFGDKGKNHISLDEFRARLAALLKVEGGKLEVLQISGGECLLHPAFCDLVDEALKHDIGRILVNTNGLALLRDDAVFEKIRAHRDRIEIYLQFDGFDDDVSERLRGRRLVAAKREIIEKLNAAEIKICLAVTVYEGNLAQIPAILALAVKTRHISGITFQRLTKVGSAAGCDIATVLQEDILLAIASSGMAAYEDIVPLPCSHENCTSLGFLFCQGDKVYSLGAHVDLAQCKDKIANRIAFDKSILDYLRKDACDCFIGRLLGGSFMLEKLQAFAEGGGSCHEDMKIVRLVVKNFMDAGTFDFERVRKCCTGVSAGDGKIVPFCIHNALKGRPP